MGMSYFSGNVDPDDYEDGFREPGSRKSRLKLNISIFTVVLLALSTTFAANISLNGGNRKEFGQGIYQIKACDQWVGLGLQSGAAPYTNNVKIIKLYGFDPRLCVGRIFRVKLFGAGSAQPLNLFRETNTATNLLETATQLSLMDTSTPYSSNYNGPGGTGYNGWAADAVTLVNNQGANVGWSSDSLFIDYDSAKGIYIITLTWPVATVAQVTSVTIESAKYS